MVKQKKKLKDPKFADELLTIIADEQEHVYPQETNTDLRDEVSKKLDLIQEKRLKVVKNGVLCFDDTKSKKPPRYPSKAS